MPIRREPSPVLKPIPVAAGEVLAAVLYEFAQSVVIPRIGQEEFDTRFPKGILIADYGVRSRLEAFVNREIQDYARQNYTPTHVTSSLKNRLTKTSVFETWRETFLSDLETEPKSVPFRSGERATGSRKAPY